MPIEKPTFGTALRFWLKLGFINFGGPAGQIAIMHDQLVEKKHWIDHDRFMHALNYCVLLPGPEAMQLATYVGWLLHGVRGGILAGVFFVLPGAALMLGLSVLYSLHGDVAWVKGLFYGLGPAVIALVAEAVLRIGRKSLKSAPLYALAATAFVAIFFFSVPFPVIVLSAALIGAWTARREIPAPPAPSTPPPSIGRALRVLAVHLLLWGAPILALGLWRGWNDNLLKVSLFFSLAAMVTFGGAYAVLGYVAQAAVGRFGWLGPHDMTVGLGLAETTPGPLILVVQFVGYLAGYNHPPAGWSPLAAGIVAALLTLWVTFVPCFLWIFLGAPYMERLRGRRRLDGALSAITAAIVGVILNLAVWLALRVLFAPLDPVAITLALAGFVAIARFKWNVIVVILGSAGMGLLYKVIA